MFSQLLKLVKDDSTLDIKGPLCGLLSVHLKYPARRFMCTCM